MYTGLLHLHSLLRYVVLLLIVLAIISAFAGWLGKKSYTNGDAKLTLFTMISVHVQFLIGFVLYFMSPLVRLSDIGAAMKEKRLFNGFMEQLYLAKRI